ncbi:hypothetical protein Hanom_Chr08g00720291 [Helianthus anomalus]
MTSCFYLYKANTNLYINQENSYFCKKKMHLFQCVPVHIMIRSTDSGHMSSTSSTENGSERLLIGSQSLLPGFKQSFSIMIHHCSINLEPFTSRCTQICQKQLHKENQSLLVSSSEYMILYSFSMRARCDASR